MRNEKGQFVKGFKPPEEYILKNRMKHIGLECKNKGEKSNLWKGGFTPINKLIRTHSKYRQWRSDIFERDNYTCVWCGARNGNGVFIELNADHIKPFSVIIRENMIKKIEDALLCEELWNMNNGRTLCRKCHLTTDTIGRPKC